VQLDVSSPHRPRELRDQTQKTALMPKVKIFTGIVLILCR